jgi:small subunit ribosomal protein S6
MAASYDLFVLLDPEAPEERRTALIEQVKSQIGSSGATLKGDADWGMRRMSYEIDHRREAQYHLFQFEGNPDALNQLDRTLSIEDAVLRHRIIRLPGEAPETTPGPSEESSRRMGDDRPSRDGGRERGGDDETASPPDSAAAPEPAQAPEEEPAVEAASAQPAQEPAVEAASAPPDEEPAVEAASAQPEQGPDETA